MRAIKGASTQSIEATVESLPQPAEIKILFWHTLLLTLLAFIVLPIYADRVFGWVDGAYIRLLIQEQHEWMSNFYLGMNIFQGLGDLFFPLMTNSVFGFMAGLALKGIMNTSVATYTLLSIEYFWGAYFLCKLFQFTPKICLLSAWLITLFAMPLLPEFHGNPLFYPTMIMVPENAETFFLSSLLLYGFNQLGKQSIRQTMFLAMAVYSTSLYLVVSTTANIIIIAPFVAYGFCALTCFATTRREAISKITVILLIVSTLTLLRYFHFLYGLLSYTVAHLMPETLSRPVSQLANVSLLFLYPFEKLFPAGSWIGGLGLLGIITAVFSGNTQQKRYSIVFFIFVLSLIGFGLIIALSSTSTYQGPHSIYFEWIVWPLYMAYSLFLLQKCLLLLKKKWGFDTGRYAFHSLTLFLLFTSLILDLNIKDDRSNFIDPPKKTPLISYLQSNVALYPGSTFAGYVATFDPSLTQGESVNWFTQVTALFDLVDKKGNDYRMTGLWYYHIPTLFEYSSLLSPALYLLTTKTMTRPIDTQMRNVMTLTKPNWRLLAALGVGYVITNKFYDKKPGITFIQSEEIDEKHGSLYLYKISQANVATYSPSHFYMLNNLDDFIDKVKHSKINFLTTVYINDPFIKKIPLVKLNDSKMIAIKNGIRLKASSKGQSTVLLPILYSHCLQATFNGKKSNNFKMIRANLAQTLIIFNKKLNVDILYKNGLLKYADCRIQDKNEFQSYLKTRGLNTANAVIQ